MRVVCDCGQLGETVAEGEVQHRCGAPRSPARLVKNIAMGTGALKTDIEYSATKCRDANCL